MHDEPSLARHLDGIQAGRNATWHELARRVERAQAEQSRASCEAMARLTPESGAAVLEVRGGLALFCGAGSPLTQALAMGLDGPLSGEELDAIEAHLTRTGSGSPQLELCPVADPSLFAALGRRGYRVQEFQLTWVQELGDEPAAPAPPAGLEVRELVDGEQEAFIRTVMAGFLECQPDEVPEEPLRLLRPAAHAAGGRLLGAFEGTRLIGGASLFMHDGVAVLGGSGVPPAFRRRGAQGALIRARLAAAAAAGCTLATSGTAPGSSSQRNMERHGFRVAYPKVVLLHP